MLIPVLADFFKSASLSFCVEGNIRVIAMVKLLSLMDSCVDVDIMVKFLDVLYARHNILYILETGGDVIS